MVNSQQFVPIEDIKNDLVFLKNGSISLIITTSAVNFSLLFETEQIAIIQSFAGLLNSLSFPIQIVVQSKTLDVSSYLHTLDQALNTQTNPLLKELTQRYRKFIASIIKENEVLDKQFYVCLNVTSQEMGLLPQTSSEKAKRGLTILGPRRDHLTRQLGRLGLKSRQLTTEELTKLFYTTYNPDAWESSLSHSLTSPLTPPPILPQAPNPQVAARPKLTLTRLPHPISYQPPLRAMPLPPSKPPSPNYPFATVNLAPPFVVEELADGFES